MIASLTRFFSFDTKARERVTLTSMAAGFATGVILNVFLDNPFAPSFYAALIALTAFYVWGLWKYVRSNGPRRAVFEMRSRIRVHVVLLVTFAGLLLVAFGPLRAIEASFVEGRIHRAIVNGQINSQESLSTARTLKAASMGLPVKLSRESRVQLRDATLNSNPQVTGFIDLANALTHYNRAMLPPSRLNPQGTPAERAYFAAVSSFETALSRWPDIIDLQEVSRALVKLSVVVALAGDNQSDLKAEAFVMQAILSSNLGRYSDALADIKSAEDLGYADLPALISSEVTALSGLGTRVGLERVIQLVTVGIQIDPPDWVTSLNPRMRTIYREELLRRRAYAFYRLGQFERAILDASEVLREGTPNPLVESDVIKILILADLGADRLDQARAVAQRWVASRGTPESRSWVHDLSPPFEAEAIRRAVDHAPPLK
jgi:hypothetical protein